jgi:transcriptional regulator with XRE-family HTH domain
VGSPREHPVERARRFGWRAVVDIGREFRDQRMSLGLTQSFVARESGISRPRYTRVEAGKVATLTLLEVYRIAAVLGMDPSMKVYPGGSPLRDGAHAERLGGVLARVARPLVHRREVPLPAHEDHFERRAWDADLLGSGARTTIELEMRLHDAQAQERRISLKRRDDPSDHFLLLVADTRTNRAVLRSHPDLFSDLPRLRQSQVVAALEAGEHPGSGLVLVGRGKPNESKRRKRPPSD